MIKLLSEKHSRQVHEGMHKKLFPLLRKPERGNQGFIMLNENGQDITSAQSDYGRVVVAVLPHPFHGRLTERVILWVRPYLNLKGERYKLTWWSDGVAYYEPVATTA